MADFTGAASSTSTNVVATVQARLDEQNAAGGVDGRKLVLATADGKSDPTQVATAAQILVQQDHIFGLVSNEPFLFGGYRYLAQQGVPVTGDGYDGPEWGNTSNMFAIAPPTFTNYNGKTYNYTTEAVFLKSIGATSVAIITNSGSPSAATSVNEQIAADTSLGIRDCYKNVSIPFGATDYTPAVLAITQAHCDTVIGVFPEQGNIALASALHNASYKGIQYYSTSYDPNSVINPTNRAILEGSYTSGLLNTRPEVRSYLDTLHKYIPGYTSDIPGFNPTTAWEATDLMIKGLEIAGNNPTRASFISATRQLKGYTIGGLASSPLDFNYLTGNLAPTMCQNYLRLVGDSFQPVPTSGNATCGKIISISASS